MLIPNTITSYGITFSTFLSRAGPYIPLNFNQVRQLLDKYSATLAFPKGDR